MEAHARAPDPLRKNNDMASNWQSWKEDFIIFMKITEYINKPQEIRANFLKNHIGKVGIDAIQSISFDKPEDKDNMDILIQKLDAYFDPPKNEITERYQFFTRSKKHNETIDQYINILKEKAKTCNFNDMTESFIRDRIILDTNDKILRKIFLEAENLDLQKLVIIYNDYNINIEKMKQVTKENRAEENSMQKSQVANNIKTKSSCWRCDHYHPLGKCPAWGSKCTKCGDINHFTHCCKGFQPNNPKGNNINKRNNNRNKKRANSKATTVNSMKKMNSLQDLTISDEIGSSPLGNDVISNRVMLSAQHSRYNNWNKKQANSKATTVNSMKKMNSLSDIPTVSDEVVSSPLGNDVISNRVMLSARHSRYNNWKKKQANSKATTVDSMKKMNSLPDIPTVLDEVVSSPLGNDVISNRVMLSAPHSRYNNWNKEQPNSKATTVNSMKKMNSLPDIPTVLDEVVSSPLGNDVISNRVMLSAPHSRYNNWNKEQPNSKATTVNSMKKMNSLPDIPTVLDEVVSSPLGNDVISNRVMLSAPHSNLNYKNTISPSACSSNCKTSVNPNSSNTKGTKKSERMTAAEAIYTSVNRSTSQTFYIPSKNISIHKYVRPMGKKKDCILC